MKPLSVLATDELAQLDMALNAMDAALVMLLERGVVTEADGVDLLDLSAAVGEEVERRAVEDGAYKVEFQTLFGQALAAGEIVGVIRPDGQMGYRAAG